MRSWTIVALAWTALTLSACMPRINIGGGNKNNDDTPAPQTNSETTTGTTGTTIALADCGPALFAHTVPFTSGDRLPFSFEIPARFGNLDASSTAMIAGSTFDVTTDGVPGEFQASYSVSRDPSADPTLASGRGESELAIQIGTESVDGWLVEGDERDLVRFLVPVGSANHLVSIEWRGPANCIEERRAIRDLALESIEPNAETIFPD